MGIGKKLAEIIELKGTNVNELAGRTGITPSTIYSIIKRDNTKVDIQVLISLCEALDVKVEVFYQEYMKNKKAPTLENKREALEEQLNTLSNSEKSTIKKYRELDDYGKEAVDSVLNIEYRRCTSAAPASNIVTSHDILEMKRAARDGRKISTEMISREEANAIKSMPDTPEDL